MIWLLNFREDMDMTIPQEVKLWQQNHTHFVPTLCLMVHFTSKASFTFKTIQCIVMISTGQLETISPGLKLFLLTQQERIWSGSGAQISGLNPCSSLIISIHNIKKCAGKVSNDSLITEQWGNQEVWKVGVTERSNYICVLLSTNRSLGWMPCLPAHWATLLCLHTLQHAWFCQSIICFIF